jgi:hypothetical protein
MNTIKIFKLILAITLLISCGSDDDNNSQNPIDQLPPETQTGANTFGCLINGEPFIVSNTSNQSAIYQGNLLQMGATLEINSDNKSIAFNLINPLNINQVYSFDNNLYKVGYSNITSDLTCIYEFQDTYQGFVTFTKIDTENFIISGTFEFSTVTDNCENINITNGRFDLQYIP